MNVPCIDLATSARQRKTVNKFKPHDRLSLQAIEKTPLSDFIETCNYTLIEDKITLQYNADSL